MPRNFPGLFIPLPFILFLLMMQFPLLINIKQIKASAFSYRLPLLLFAFSHTLYSYLKESVFHYVKQNTMFVIYQVLLITNKKQNNFFKTGQHIFSLEAMQPAPQNKCIHFQRAYAATDFYNCDLNHENPDFYTNVWQLFFFFFKVFCASGGILRIHRYCMSTP